jgi:hypothetical protein
MMTAFLHAAIFSANVPALFDDNNHMTNELHAIAPSDGHNQMGNEGNNFWLSFCLALSEVNDDCSCWLPFFR